MSNWSDQRCVTIGTDRFEWPGLTWPALEFMSPRADELNLSLNELDLEGTSLTSRLEDTLRTGEPVMFAGIPYALRHASHNIPGQDLRIFGCEIRIYYREYTFEKIESLRGRRTLFLAL